MNAVNIKTVSSNYTLEAGVDVVLCDANAGDFAVQWPPELIGREVAFKKISTSGEVTIQAPDGCSIYDDSDTGIHLDSDREVRRMIFDGTTIYQLN